MTEKPEIPEQGEEIVFDETPETPDGPPPSIIKEAGDFFPGGIAKQIEEARELSRKTGMRVRKRFDKKEFLKQFPHAAQDPRFALTPDNFVLDFTPLVAVEVGEIRRLALRKKEHPMSAHMVVATEGKRDDQVVYILKEDYQVLKAED